MTSFVCCDSAVLVCLNNNFTLSWPRCCLSLLGVLAVLVGIVSGLVGVLGVFRIGMVYLLHMFAFSEENSTPA